MSGRRQPRGIKKSKMIGSLIAASALTLAGCATLASQADEPTAPDAATASTTAAPVFTMSAAEVWSAFSDTMQSNICRADSVDAEFNRIAFFTYSEQGLASMNHFERAEILAATADFCTGDSESSAAIVPDQSRQTTQPPSLTTGDFKVWRPDGTTVTGTLGMSEVIGLDDSRVEAWMNRHGLGELPCRVDPSRDAVVLGELSLENATPDFSIEKFGVEAKAYGGAVGTHFSSGSQCGTSFNGEVVESVLRFNPKLTSLRWEVPIQVVVRDYYSPQHPDGQLPVDYELTFAGYFDNVVSNRTSEYRGDLFDLSEDMIWYAPVRIQG